MKDFLHHLFVPHHSNNHRARILHFDSLLFFVVLFLWGLLLLPVTKTRLPDVLGVSIDISTQQLLSITNKDRLIDGEQPLTLNTQLSQAAAEKAKNMFAKNYWAHNAPDGTTPWVFIKDSGYDYIYAGENLARGFTTANGVVTAWMNSQGHRDNMLSKNYKDVGFAVMQGKLNGEDTVLVVEMFGSQTLTPAQNKEITSSSAVPAQANKILENPQTFGVSIKNMPLINSLLFSRNLGISVLILFISVLSLDMIIVERKKIVRLVGHNIDHIFFLAMILIIIVVMSHGVIL